MSTLDPSEGSEDVQEFLKRIRELSDKRDKEDAERTRKLEEDILEGRRQREARRLERARSLSPEKQSRPGTPSSRYASPRLSARPDSAASHLDSPRLAPVADSANGKGYAGESPVTQVERSTPSRLEPPMSKPKLPARIEQASSSISSSRPNSTTGTEEPKTQESRANTPAKHLDEDTLSKLEAPAPKPVNEITKPAPPPKPTNVPARAGTLSWQQRPGSLRGVRSRPMSLAADRAPSPLTKSASVPEPESMSRDAIAESLGSKDALFFRQTADRGTSSAAYRKSQVEDTDVVDLPTNKVRLHGLVDTSKQEVEREKEEPATSSPIASPPPSGVGKPRVQTPVGRSNTVRASWASPLPTQASQMFSPAGSPESAMPYSSATLGRPGSPTKGVGSFVQSAMAKRSDSVSKRWSAQTSPSVSRANSVAASRNNVGASPESREKHGVDLSDPQSPEQSSSMKDDAMTSPSSPSKRFSPVKASWLESALTRPESPKVSTGPQQPSWMAELHKTRIQRSSVDVTSAMKESGMDKVNPSTLNGGRNLGEIKGQPMLPEKKPKPSVLEKPSETPKDDVFERKNTDTPLYSSGSIKGKPKPVTPPKKDFRSTLKPREQPADNTDKSELEFRNAAGKLKRTVTEKYVAPDILKDNIARGKAGLALTDGPQKSPTKDEFKDSLLKQKETMQTKGGESSRSRSTSPVKRSTTPEAIARRRMLANKASAPNLKAVAASVAAEEVEKKQEPQALPARTLISPQPLRKETVASSKLAERFNPNLASILARGPSPFVPSEAPASPATSARPRETRSASPEAGDSKPLQHMTKGRAKGPKRRAPKTETPTVAAKQESRPPMPRKSSSDVRAVSTHKPRVASSSRRVTPSFVSAESEPEPAAALSDRRKSLTWPTQTSKDDQTTTGAVSTPPTIKSPSSTLPPKPSKPNGLRSISGTQASSIIEIDENTEKVDGKETPATNNDIGGLSVRGAAAKWGRPMTMEKKKEIGPLSSPIEFNSTKAQRSTSSSSLLVPTNETVGQKLATSPRTPQPAAKPASLGSSAVKTPVTTLSNGTPSTASSTSSLIPRTTEAGRLIGDFFQNPSNARTHLDVDTSTIVATGLAQDTAKLKTLRRTIVELNHDGTTSSLPLQQDHVLYSASMYLCTHIFGNASTGARTTEVYLWTGVDVSQTHIPAAISYATSEAKKVSATFIPLLQGEEVTNFLQALGGILVTRNGSYSATQKSAYLLRGRRHFGHLTFDEVDLVTTSLCPGFPCILVPASGNKGVGPDKIYLWKGTGAHHEEVAGARLMAMDIGSLADIIEVDCGAETSEFLSLFPNTNAHAVSKPSGYAPYWSQKSKSENYRVRLFQVSSSPTSAANEPLSTVSAFWRAAAGKSATTANNNSSNPASSNFSTTLTEITPFTQSSLAPSNIYVLDAFFTIYILIGPLARAEFQAFSSALLFAQDYAILAASAEDRPAVPKGWVVFEVDGGLDVRACFRRWDTARVGTEMLMAGSERMRGGAGRGMGEGKSVPVDSCIAACKGV